MANREKEVFPPIIQATPPTNIPTKQPPQDLKDTWAQDRGELVQPKSQVITHDQAGNPQSGQDPEPVPGQGQGYSQGRESSQGQRPGQGHGYSQSQGEVLEQDRFLHHQGEDDFTTKTGEHAGGGVGGIRDES